LKWKKPSNSLVTAPNNKEEDDSDSDQDNEIDLNYYMHMI